MHAVRHLQLHCFHGFYSIACYEQKLRLSDQFAN